jgi:hypothetical protein
MRAEVRQIGGVDQGSPNRTHLAALRRPISTESRQFVRRVVALGEQERDDVTLVGAG